MHFAVDSDNLSHTYWSALIFFSEVSHEKKNVGFNICNGSYDW